MAGKAINQYNTFSGSASDVNVLVQETSQTDPNTYEHKKAKLDTIIATLKNIANGLAGLDGNGLIPESLLPAKYDDVVEGYYYNGVFYTTSAHTTAMTATTGRIYIDLGGTGNLYRYTGSAYVQITDNDLRDDVEEDVAEIEADLANTNNRVTSNSQRIANIEDKSEPFTIEYPSSDYGKGTVPASIEKSGMSVKVKGRSRAWNQLSNAGEVITNSTTDTRNSLSLFWRQYGEPYSLLVATAISTQQIGTASFSGMTELIHNGSIANINFASPFVSVVEGHKYLFIVDVAGDDPTTVGGIELDNLIIRDLTLTFGAGNEPTSVTDALKALPDLGKYNAYGYSLPSTIVSGMRAISPNIWDEEWELGAYSLLTGEKDTNNSCVRNKNLVPVKPSTGYQYSNATNDIIRFVYYDRNKNWCGYLSGTLTNNKVVFTTPSNAFYMSFYYTGTTYNHDIQICLNSYPQKTVYHPYSSNTLTFSEPVTLRSAGSVEDELIPESGVVKHPVKEIDLTDVVFTYNSSIQRFYCALYDGKAVSSPVYSNPNAVCSAYVNINNANKVYSELANMQFVFADRSFNSTPFFIFRDDSHDGSSLDSSGHAPWLSGHKLAYELATPSTETLSPSPTALAVEPYGEVSLIQDQDIELDGGFSMRYIPDSPYVKKADIVDNLNSTDVSKPLSANMGRVIGATLDQHDSRLQNLEQKAGDYVEVQYRGTDAVPTGKAKYGLVKSIVGKTRAWNQLIPNSDISGSASGSSASTYEIIKGINRSIDNHKYLITVRVSSLTGSNQNLVYYLQIGTSYSSGNVSAFIGTLSGVNLIFLGVTTTDATAIGSYSIAYDNLETYDLTLIFGSGNEPSTVADALAQLPALGQYNAYDAGSLVDTVVSGARSTSINIWDEQWEVGGINSVSGANDNSVSNRIRSKNFIPVSQSTAYYITCPQECYVFFYDANHNYMNRYEEYHNNYFETYTASYIKICPVSSYGTTYQNNITIAKGSTAVTYRPHILDTLSLPETVTLRSAGSVADELDVESGVVTRNVGVVDLSTLTWITPYENRKMTTELRGIIKPPIDTTSLGNYLSAKGYTQLTASSTLSHEGEYAVLDTGDVLFYDNGTLPSGMFAYELATPTTESIDPIPYNFLEVEGGGTVETIQTQTPVIDNCLDVGYLAV